MRPSDHIPAGLELSALRSKVRSVSRAPSPVLNAVARPDPSVDRWATQIVPAPFDHTPRSESAAAFRPVRLKSLPLSWSHGSIVYAYSWSSAESDTHMVVPSDHIPAGSALSVARVRTAVSAVPSDRA